jgi:hypothetical protein
MAADLAGTPSSGLRGAVVRGDAHLSNLGVRFAGAAPVFDVNDFDETLPGRFEVGCQAAGGESVVAGGTNGFPTKAAARSSLAAARVPAPRCAVRATVLLEVWYAHLDIEQTTTSSDRQIKRKG